MALPVLTLPANPPEKLAFSPPLRLLLPEQYEPTYPEPNMEKYVTFKFVAVTSPNAPPEIAADLVSTAGK